MADHDDVYQRMPELLELLTAACRMLGVLPLAAMAAANEAMQTLGPILEPTAYVRGGGQNLHDQRRIIDAALALQQVCQDVAGTTAAHR
jgi:ApbE superfamily uncharacterized protein (UPF0280 family)